MLFLLFCLPRHALVSSYKLQVQKLQYLQSYNTLSVHLLGVASICGLRSSMDPWMRPLPHGETLLSVSVWKTTTFLPNTTFLAWSSITHLVSSFRFQARQLDKASENALFWAVSQLQPFLMPQFPYMSLLDRKLAC